MRILILGGYGFFGTLLAKRLARNPQFNLIIAGRSLEKAEKIASELPAKIASLSVDATNSTALRAALTTIKPDVVVNTCGPFQARDYQVAEACIAVGCHYIDLADGRDFVTHIDQLHSDAIQKNVLIVSGASSVPAVSSAVTDRLAAQLNQLFEIDIGISPGNKTDRGLATVAGILSYCGAPIRGWRNGKPTMVYGWMNAHRHRYPHPVGNRWLSDCDVPDLELFPKRYSALKSVRFRAGLELPVLQLGMVIMSLMRRIGGVSDWSRYASPLKQASEWFRYFGSDNGAMHVSVKGTSVEGNPISLRWTLVANAGDGPYVPVLASAALIRKLLNGSLKEIGAMPCIGLLTLEEILMEAEGLEIDTTIEQD